MSILRAMLFCLLALGASVVSSAQTNPTIPVKVSSPNGQIDLNYCSMLVRRKARWTRARRLPKIFATQLNSMASG